MHSWDFAMRREAAFSLQGLSKHLYTQKTTMTSIVVMSVEVISVALVVNCYSNRHLVCAPLHCLPFGQYSAMYHSWIVSSVDQLLSVLLHIQPRLFGHRYRRKFAKIVYHLLKITWFSTYVRFKHPYTLVFFVPSPFFVSFCGSTRIKYHLIEHFIGSGSPIRFQW